jgi:hypothetical protein
MSSTEGFGIVEALRVLNAGERKFLVAARQSEREAVVAIPLCQNTAAGARPAFLIQAAKHWRSALVVLGCALLALSTLHSPLAAQENAPPAQSDQTQPANPPDEHERILLPAGTVISVRIADRVDSNHLHSGDLLTGMVDPSLIYNDRVLIPRGTEAHVRMAENKKGGHLHGKAEVELELIGLVMNGRKLEVESDTYQKDQGALAAKVKSAGPASAGAGANVATGSGPGSGVSPVIAIFHAAKVDLPPDTRVKFTLTAPFTFVKPPADSGK